MHRPTLRWQFFYSSNMLHKHSLLYFFWGKDMELCRRTTSRPLPYGQWGVLHFLPAPVYLQFWKKKLHLEWCTEALLDSGMPSSLIRTRHWIKLNSLWPSFLLKPVLLLQFLIPGKLDGYVWYPWQPSLKQNMKLTSPLCASHIPDKWN